MQPWSVGVRWRTVAVIWMLALRSPPSCRCSNRFSPMFTSARASSSPAPVTLRSWTTHGRLSASAAPQGSASSATTYELIQPASRRVVRRRSRHVGFAPSRLLKLSPIALLAPSRAAPHSVWCVGGVIGRRQTGLDANGPVRTPVTFGRGVAGAAPARVSGSGTEGVSAREVDLPERVVPQLGFGRLPGVVAVAQGDAQNARRERLVSFTLLDVARPGVAVDVVDRHGGGHLVADLCSAVIRGRHGRGSYRDVHPSRRGGCHARGRRAAVDAEF